MSHGAAKRGSETRPDPDAAAKAFQQVSRELSALRPEDLVALNFDVPQAVAVVLGARPRILALRDRIAEELPSTPLTAVDGLERNALAALYAHLVVVRSRTPDAGARQGVEEGRKLREDLLVAAEALAHAGLLDVQRVAEIRGGNGNIDMASDLVALAALFAAEWERVGQRTAVTTMQVKRAAELGPELLAAFGLPQPPQVPAADEAGLRARAVTLLVRAYDECQRAIGYLRWHEGDAEQIAPSIYQKRRKRAAQAEPPASENAAPAAPPAPAPVAAP